MSSEFFWQVLPSVAKDIGVGAAGDAWILGPAGEILQWTGAAWSRVSGAAEQIAVGPDGSPWIVGTDDALHHREDEQWKQIDVPVVPVDLAVANDGTVWIVGADQSVHVRVGDGFQRHSGVALRIAVGPDRRPWIISGDLNVWRHDGEKWVAYPLAGCMDLAVGADGTAWAIDGGRRIHRLDGTTWVPTRHLAVRLGADHRGHAWAVRPDGNVVRRRATSVRLATRDDVVGVWHELPGRAHDIAVGPEGHAWIVGTDGQVWQFSGREWHSIECVARRISVGVNNTPWIVGSEHAVWTRVGEGWRHVFSVPSGVQDLAVAPSGNVYVAANDQSIYRWAGGAPIKLTGGATRVTVDNNDDLWIVGFDRAVYRYADGAWPRIVPPGGGALDIAAGVDGSIWVTAADFRAYKLDDAGVGWIATGQTANNISVGPDGAAWVTQPDTRMFRQMPSRRASLGRDFVISLFWRHLGRAHHPAELEHHHHRLRNRSIDRAGLDAEFANCEGGRQRRAFVLRDFVQYLSWRYFGRDMHLHELDHHHGRLLAGLATSALDAEFRDVGIRHVGPIGAAAQVTAGYWRHYGRGPSPAELQQDLATFTNYEQFDAVIRVRPEAREHARPLLRDFVYGLFWRYLGHQGPEHQVDDHHNRLLAGPIVHEQLEREFSTCPGAQAYLPAPAPLQVLAACYTGAKDGQEDVTARIRSWISEDQILAWWTPADLGAEGNGWGQNLVIVYRYGDGPARTMIVPAGWAIELSPREDDRHNAGSPRPRPGREQLTILGAAYGRSDVTAAARLKVRDDNRLYADVNDATWGVPGPNGSTRTLVVVYQVGAGPPVIHMTRKDKRAFVNAPPLQILGATYGTIDITQAIAAQVRNGTVEVQADLRLAGQDPWPGVWKSVAIVFRYGDEFQEAGVIVKPDREMILITPDLAPPPRSEEEGKKYGLHILGAVYGLADRTQQAREAVVQDAFQQVADEATWGDTWPGWPKSLTVVYQIDGGRPLLRSVLQGFVLSITAPQILGAAWGTLDVTDAVAAQVRGGSLTIPATNAAFGDSLPGLAKSLVVVYRHGDQTPRVAIAEEGGAAILTDVQQSVPGHKPTVGLRILGAAWGLRDVTAAARFHDRDFVASLFLRYIKREPNPAEFEHHVGRLVSGVVVDAQQEQEFATCPEAQQVGPPGDLDYVRSLYRRWLGRAPDQGGLDFHVARLAGGYDRALLEEEFRTCPEAHDVGHLPRDFRADNDWGDGWPGETKTLVIVYQVDGGPPRTAIALEGEKLVLPEATPTTGAHLAAKVRLLQDYQITPEQTIDVVPGTVVAVGDAATSRATPMPAPRGVHQIVLVPRRKDGTAAAGARVTLVCGEPVELVSDQPGKTTLYRLPAHVALEFVVPESGRLRFSLPVKDGQITCPLLRARWAEMAADTWAVIAPDSDMQQRMADLEATDLLYPQPGKTSPLGRHDAARARALQTTLAPAMRAALATRIRVHRSGAVRLAELVALEQPPLVKDESLPVPPHVRVAGDVGLSRVMITGAARFYALRRVVPEGGPVSMFIDDIVDFFEDLGDSLSSAFTSGLDAVASAFTTAFNATIGGLEGAFRATVEGVQSLVSVAEKLAVDAVGSTADTFRNAQCVLVDATNGLVAFAVTVSGGVVSVARVVIRELTDLALLIADNVRRVALEIKQIIEFLLMLFDWGDILETQRRIADMLEGELDELPGAAAAAGPFVRATFDSAIALLDLPAGPSMPGLVVPRSLPLGALGEAFEFLWDRIGDFIGAFGGGPSLDAGPLGQAARKVGDALAAAKIVVPDPKQLVGITSPNELLDRLKQAGRAALIALRDASQLLLDGLDALFSAAKAVLRARIYIPVVTDLIEEFILGRELTLLNLVTLLAGAAYTVIYKLEGKGTGSPVATAPPAQPYAARLLQRRPAQPQLTETRPPPPPPPASSDDGNRRLSTAMQLTSALASLTAVPLRYQEQIEVKLVGHALALVASLSSLSATAIYPQQFGDWWPSELTTNLANLCSELVQVADDIVGGLTVAQIPLGVAQATPALVTGIGTWVDGTQSEDMVAALTAAEVCTGLADCLVSDDEARAVLLTGNIGARIGLCVLQIESL